MADDQITALLEITYTELADAPEEFITTEALMWCYNNRVAIAHALLFVRGYDPRFTDAVRKVRVRNQTCSVGFHFDRSVMGVYWEPRNYNVPSLFLNRMYSAASVLFPCK